MTPFDHTGTILATPVIVGGSCGSNPNYIPEGKTMTTVFKTDTYSVESQNSATEATPTTASFAFDNETILVGRNILEEESTPVTKEAAREADIHSAKLLRRAENRADETGHAPIFHEAPLRAPDFSALNELAGHAAVEDVLEEQEAQINFGLRVLAKADGDALLTLTTDGSYCFDLTLRQAEPRQLMAFSQKLLDFKVYDLEAERDMLFVSQNLISTGRQLDSLGFEAIAWEDSNQRAFIRHCLNVARALGYNLYVDLAAEKRCKELCKKGTSGALNELVAPRSIAVDDAPEWLSDSGEVLTAVYAYAKPEATRAVAKTVVAPAAVVAPKAVPSVAPEAPQAVPTKSKSRWAKFKAHLKAQKLAKGKPVSQSPKVSTPVTTSKPVSQSPKVDAPAKTSKPVRQFLQVSEHVTMKVQHFVPGGVVLKDELGNEGFLRVVGKGKGGGVKHSRLVVNPGDEVKVVVAKVDGRGFVQTSLISVSDPTNHYLSCLRIGAIHPGVVLRRRSDHCYYVAIGGPLDGILAVQKIPNLPEVKDKLQADARLDVRVVSVNSERRKFHVEIASFHVDK